ncbi:hypothetical protein [Marinicella sediminis]|uniref:hypothetical protein n=1 Tax=Marinicella sediminis TaxID=1792834 RepID=UPI000986D5EE|nr:hypothetical protein [Marinicella sediminis]
MIRLTALFLLCVVSHNEAATISTETFFKNPDLTAIKISPDGKHFAATTETDGVKKLVILDVNATQILQVFDFSSEKREIGNFGWLNNERIYATMVRKVGPLDQPSPTGFLFAGNINGKKTIQLLPAKSRTKGGNRDIQRPFRILNLLPDDDKHILISLMDDNRFTYAYRLNVYNGRQKVVGKSAEPFSRLMADHSGKIKVSTNSSDDGSEYFIHLWNQAEEQWQLFKKFDDKGINLRPLEFSADNNLLYIENDSGDSGRGIYALDLSSQDYKLIHAINGDADIQALIRDFNQVTPDVIGFTRMPGHVEVEFFDPNHQVAKLYRSLYQSFQGQAINLVNASADGQQVVVRVWSDYNPGNHYLMDLNSNQVKPLFKTLPWIDRRQIPDQLHRT